MEAEHTLVRQAQAGAPGARDELASRIRQPAYLLALQLVGNTDDALDIAQEAMLRFFVSLDRFDSARAVRPWLFAIVRNRARDFWRQRTARPAEALDAGPDIVGHLVDGQPDPEQALASAERRQQVWRAIGRLSADHREILVLRDFHDLTYTEIADVLDIPVGTVMSRLHAARKAFGRQVTTGARDG